MYFSKKLGKCDSKFHPFLNYGLPIVTIVLLLIAMISFAARFPTALKEDGDCYISDILSDNTPCKIFNL